MWTSKEVLSAYFNVFLGNKASDGSPILLTYLGDLGPLIHPLGMSHL